MQSVPSSADIRLELPAEAVERLVDQVVERVRAELSSASPWMTRADAAAYLRVPLSRLEKARDIPCHRWDGRILYCRPELDEWMTSQ